MSSIQLLDLKDGRQLAFQLFGTPGGRPLFFFHGFPGSRLQASLVHAQAAAADVCLIGIDRPGFGQSSPAPARTILGWSGDVVQLADHLGYRRFGVIGASCGGPYALACAHQIPARLSYVGLLAGMAPMDIPSIRQGQLPLLRIMFFLARVNPWLISPLLNLDRILFRSSPQRAIRALTSLLTEPDRRLLSSDPRVSADFSADLAEAYRQGVAGPMREAQLIASPRGFSLEDIRVPVHLYQGHNDRHVPPAMARYMASAIPEAHLQMYGDEGHLSIAINRFSDCLRDFLVRS